MIELVKKRLASLGYTVTDTDLIALDFEILKERDYIESECGCIPDELRYHMIDWIVASFLLAKKSEGALESIGTTEFTSAPLRALTEGDVRVEWGGSGSSGVKTPDERVDEITQGLLKTRKLIALYRRIKW